MRTLLTIVFFALTVALAACQPAPEPPAYRYSDRDLWKAVPQQTLPLEGDTLTMHTIAQPQTDGSHVFLFFGDPSAQPNNGDALVMQHLAQANPRSAVWYIDTPDALFMERDRVAMRNHSGDFVPPVLSQLSRQFASITLVAMDVTGVPLLRGLRQWQAQTSAEDRARLSQVVLLYPSLYVNTGYPVSSLDIDLAEMDGETTCL